MNSLNLTELLDCINPAELNYEEWLSVGMALKIEGYTVYDWDNWSKTDIKRYHVNECKSKWETFNGAASPVTAGTIVQIAKEHGWRPQSGEYEIDWDDIIGRRDNYAIVNTNWIESRTIKEPSDWNPVRELTTYLETLFDSTEIVGYVTDSWECDGSYMPTKGNYDRTAGELIQALNKCDGDIGAVLGDYREEVGAWIRFNPLDGKGVRNENVTEYRYALVESDSMEIDRQNALLRELELPIACLVHSGKKSIHAIVRVEAGTYQEYQKRVDYLYSVCKKNGLELDRQNRNPSRLSRMPGVIRNGKKQFLIDVNIGKKSWDEWYEWVESINDDLPDPENMSAAWDNLPELAPPLIDGILRMGHKMLLAGPSKAGKSYALIELCCSLAEGLPWLGFKCRQGKVMYVNLELDRASCLHRFKDVYTACDIKPVNIGNIDIWNLRGKSIPMDKLAPKLIRRAAKKDYAAIIIDPIYKVITGDENSADQMAHFCNQFDRVCNELGCAVIYCHHHSKGAQGGKKSMDRASGSGVFARDPDALLDLTELEPTEDILKQKQNKAVCDICAEWLRRYNLLDKVGQDDLCSSSAMLDTCRELLQRNSFNLMMADVERKKESVKRRTAWRIEGTLREFPRFEPVNLWFDYPIHKVDEAETLKDIQPEAEKPPWQKANKARKEKAGSKREKDRVKFENAIALCNAGEPPTVREIAEYLNMNERTIRDWIKKYGYSLDKSTGKITKSDDCDE